MRRRLVTLGLTGVFSTAMVHVASGESYFADNIWGEHYPQYHHLQFSKGRTYVAMSATASDDPHIWAYDHDLGTWEGPVKIGVNNLDSRNHHGNPSLVIDHQGYIHLWYGGHGKRPGEYARSAEPGNIQTWVHPEFDGNFTYPMPWVMSDGTIYVFFRNGNHTQPGSARWIFLESSDNGKTWSKPIVAASRMARETGADLYCVAVKYPGQDRIGIGIGDEWLDGSPTHHTTEDLFYIWLDTTTGTFYNIQGDPIGGENGVGIAELLARCHVADYEALGNKNKRISCRPAITADGTVHLLATNGNPGGFERLPKENWGGLPRIYYWDDGEWLSSDSKRNFTDWVDAEGNRLVTWGWTSTKGTFARLESSDHGLNWIETSRATLPTRALRRWGFTFNAGNHQAHLDAQIVIFEVGPWAVNRAYLWGESGFREAER